MSIEEQEILLKKEYAEAIRYMNNAKEALAKALKAAYNTLHLAGYYDGNVSVKVIQSGFEEAYDIIEKINPDA